MRRRLLNSFRRPNPQESSDSSGFGPLSEIKRIQKLEEDYARSAEPKRSSSGTLLVYLIISKLIIALLFLSVVFWNPDFLPHLAHALELLRA